MATEAKVLEAIEILEGTFTRWQTNEKTIKAWVFSLRDLSDEQLNYGLIKFLDTATSDFNRTPVPGDLKQHVLNAQGVTWEMAWNEALNKHAAYNDPPLIGWRLRPPTFSSPLIPEIIDLIGVGEFIHLKDGQHTSMRAQFRDMWHNVENRQGGTVLIEQYTPPVKGELSAPDPAKMLEVREDLNENGLTPDQQSKANNLSLQFQAKHSDIPQNKIIPMAARKLSQKRSMDRPAPQGWQEELKRGQA